MPPRRCGCPHERMTVLICIVIKKEIEKDIMKALMLWFLLFPFLDFFLSKAPSQCVTGFSFPKVVLRKDCSSLSRRNSDTFRRGSTCSLLLAQQSQEDKPKEKPSLLGKSNIPPELRKKIYEAEGNTNAAKERRVRLPVFILLTFLGSVLGIGNGVLTELSDSAAEGWLFDNPFVTTKWGGILALLSAGLFGTLAELEWRSRDENAERIWEEMKRRQAEETRKKNSKRQRATSVSTSKGGAKSDSKLSKRFSELAEILQNDDQEKLPIVVAQEEQKREEGFLEKIKNFYKQADDMAAAQALLLNKKLEDGGVLEKITDESGLKVIGKEAAAKLTTQEIAEENSTSRSN